MRYLDSIRAVKQPRSFKLEMLTTVAILIFGCCMGLFSKYMDYQQASLPSLLRMIDSAIDLHNYLGEFAPWVFVAVCISVFSNTPVRAAINVFLFFAGMVLCYYLYCKYAAGFFPQSYAMIWIGFTILSPLLAFFCWYAKGKGIVAVLLAAGIIGFFFIFSFNVGLFYISVRSWISIILLVLTVVILRQPFKNTAIMVGIGIVFFVVFSIFSPYRI